RNNRGAVFSRKPNELFNVLLVFRTCYCQRHLFVLGCIGGIKDPLDIVCEKITFKPGFELVKCSLHNVLVLRCKNSCFVILMQESVSIIMCSREFEKYDNLYGQLFKNSLPGKVSLDILQ